MNHDISATEIGRSQQTDRAPCMDTCLSDDKCRSVKIWIVGSLNVSFWIVESWNVSFWNVGSWIISTFCIVLSWIVSSFTTYLQFKYLFMNYLKYIWIVFKFVILWIVKSWTVRICKVCLKLNCQQLKFLLIRNGLELKYNFVSLSLLTCISRLDI